MEFNESEFGEVLNIFRNESMEILLSMDNALLMLEKEPQNTDLILQLFRYAHSLKGSARMLGFNGIQSIMHKVEDIIDLFKKKELFPSPKALEVISSALECVEDLIEKTYEKRAEYSSSDIGEHIKKLEGIVEKAQGGARGGVQSNTVFETKQILGELEFSHEAKPEIEEATGQEMLMEAGLLAAQEVIAAALKSGVQDMFVGENASNDLEDLAEKIKRLETNIETLPQVRKLLEQLIKDFEHTKEEQVFQIILSLLKNYEDNHKPFERDTLAALSDILSDFSKLCEYRDEVERQKQVDSLVQRVNIVEKIVQINIKGISMRAPTQGGGQNFNSQDWFDNMDANAIKTLRIDSAKLDKLVGQIGELIITRIKNTEQLPFIRAIKNDFLEWQKDWNKVGHFIKYFDKKYLASNIEDENLQNIIAYNRQLITLHATQSEKLSDIFAQIDACQKRLQENDMQLNSVTNGLEAMVKSIRILPLATIFHLFPRMVHNIAKDKGREVEFKVWGSEVSADKKIIEDIKIPIMHILRNSIDHGIEDPDEREKLGKKRSGEISVSAQYTHERVVITIKDDGRGLDAEKIKARALEKGFLTQDEIKSLPEDQIMNLIFYPGFSTGETVTELSGRGLGLDIVHTKISQLNGRIDVYSEYQKGTVTTIELPATMATVKAFVVLECGQLFTFPASSIKTVTRIDPKDVFQKDDKNYFIYLDKIIPIFTLSQILNYGDHPRKANKYTLLIIESENSQLGIIVEKLIGEEEILHKKLPMPFSKIKNISGITTLANGKTSLILNVTDILNTTIAKKSMAKITAVNVMEKIRKNKDYQILIVDDSITTRTMQKNIIERHGYRTQLATNASDALGLLKVSKFDLIVSDNEMPQMSGLEFLREVRQNEDWAQIPIIVLTSSDENLWRDKFLKAGAKNFLKKGEFNQETFIERIDELLNEA